MWSPERPPVRSATSVTPGSEMAVSGGTATREMGVVEHMQPPDWTSAGLDLHGLRRAGPSRSARDALNEPQGFTICTAAKTVRQAKGEVGLS